MERVYLKLKILYLDQSHLSCERRAWLQQTAAWRRKKEILPLRCLMLSFYLSRHLTRIQNSVFLGHVPGPLDHDGGELPRTGHPIPTAAREMQAVQLGENWTCALGFLWTPNTACGGLKSWPLLHQVKNNVLLVVNFHISQLLSLLRSS